MTDIDDADLDEDWVEVSVLNKEREWSTKLETENAILRTRIAELEAKVTELETLVQQLVNKDNDYAEYDYEKPNPYDVSGTRRERE